MEEGVYIGNLQIPIAKGEKGDTGAAGKIKSINVVMLSSTATAYAQNNGTENEAQLELGIPKGVGISNVEIVDEDLIVHLDNGTDLNCGGVVGLGVVSIVLNEDYDFIMTLSDGSTETVGNIETALRNMLTDYYTSAETDDILDRILDEIKETFGHSLSMTLNPTTYVLTVGLNDYNGTSLDTKTVDLPLESVVVSGRYDNTTKKVILTLQNGSTVEFSVADLVAGLQSEITSNNKLSADLVDDTNTTNKFVTSAEKTKISNAVTFSDYATGSKSGVFMLGDGIFLNSNRLNVSTLSTEQITDGRHNSYITGVGSVINAIKTRISSSVSSSSTNEYAVGAKLFYDTIGDIDSALDAINGEVI